MAKIIENMDGELLIAAGREGDGDKLLKIDAKKGKLTKKVKISNDNSNKSKNVIFISKVLLKIIVERLTYNVRLGLVVVPSEFTRSRNASKPTVGRTSCCSNDGFPTGRRSRAARWEKLSRRAIFPNGLQLQEVGDFNH